MTESNPSTLVYFQMSRQNPTMKDTSVLDLSLPTMAKQEMVSAYLTNQNGRNMMVRTTSAAVSRGAVAQAGDLNEADGHVQDDVREDDLRFPVLSWYAYQSKTCIKSTT